MTFDPGLGGIDPAATVPAGDASPVRTAVLAAYPAVRAGLRALLESAAGIAVVAELPPAVLGSPGRDDRFDVLVADLNGEPEGLRAGIAAAYPGMPVVFLAAEAQDHTPVPHVPSGYLLRHAGAEEIAAAVRAVALGLTVYDPAVPAAVHLDDGRPAPARDADGGEPLTDREVEVLALLALGLPNKGIAQRLGISEHTAKFHVGAILAKLGAAGRTEAVMLAARRGLVSL